MRLGIAVCVTLLLACAAAPPCGAEIIAEYLGPHSNNGLVVENNASAYFAHAQRFAVAGSPTVTEVQLYLSRWTGSTGYVYMYLCHDSTVTGAKTSYPGGAFALIPVATSSVPSDEAWVSFKWGGTQLYPGKFWIICLLTDNSDARIDWWGKRWDGNNYGTGDDVMTSKDKRVTWPILQGIDPMFRVFGTRATLNTTTTVSVDPSTVATSGSATVTVTVRETLSGNLVQGPGQVDVSATEGTLGSDTLTLSNGTATTTWTAPGSTGTKTISADFNAFSFAGNDYNASSDDADVTVVAQQRTTTTAQTVPSPTNTRATINIAVAVTDNTNPPNVINGGKVTFSCSAGTFGTNPVTVSNGSAPTTWTAPNTTGVYTITASYSGWNSGAIVYGASSDSDNVTVDYTDVNTTTTVTVAPDYPYVSGKAWVKVEVKDGTGKAVPAGDVLLMAPSGSFDSTTITLANGKGNTIYHAPASPGDVVITGTYQQYLGGGNRYQQSSGNATAHVTRDTDSGGENMTYLLEWITDYAWWQIFLPDLDNTDDDAHGFGNKLKNDFGWTGPDKGNDNAQQDHFKLHSLGGRNNDYLDKHDFTYYSGHGSPDCITFNNLNDDVRLWSDQAYDAWGEKDCEWVLFSACKVMVKDSYWAACFNGAHLQLGYTTNMWDSDTFGGTFANLLTKDSLDDEAHPITQAFFLAGDQDLDNTHKQRVIGENSAMFDDYIWGQGFVNADPNDDTRYSWISNDVDVNNAPHADADGPYNGIAGQKVQLDGSASWDPDSGDTITYVWDMDTSVNSDSGDWDNDGVDESDDDSSATGRRAEYTYAGAGNYNIRLMIRDNAWQVATDTTTANIAAGSPPGGPSQAPPASAEVGGIEIVDKFNPAGLPTETQLPKFTLVGTTLGYDALAHIADFYGVSGSAEIDSVGNWNMVQGATELIVNAYSGGVMYIDRSMTYTFTHVPGPLPSRAQCVAAANVIMNWWGIPHDDAVVDGFTDCSISDNEKGGRAADTRTPFQRCVDYRRLFTVPQVPLPVQYPAVGPGGKMRMILDDTVGYDSRGFVKVWREVVQGADLNLVGAAQAVQDFHRLVGRALYGSAYVPECKRIEIDNVSIGYYEENFVTYQDTIYPVYVLDLTCENDTSSFKTRVFVPAAWSPLEANISSPSDGAEFDYGTQITFNGSAAGGTAPYTYEWYSDRDGLLGSGSSIARSDLSVDNSSGQPAYHSIMLKVSDANNLTATSYVSIMIKPTEIGNAKKSPDTTPVSMLGQVVTASFSDYFYMENADRTSGVAVLSSAMPPENSVMAVQGQMTTSYEERSIQASGVEILGTTDPIEPLATTVRSIGGGDFGTPPLGQKGITGPEPAFGLNNVGLLMRVAGKVDYAVPGSRFVVTDGVSRTYCMPGTGVTVTIPSVGDKVIVTGVSSIGYLGPGNLWRLLTVRGQDDILPIQAQ